MTTRRQLWPATRPIRNTNSTHCTALTRPALQKPDRTLAVNPGEEGPVAMWLLPAGGACSLRYPICVLRGRWRFELLLTPSMPSVLTTDLPDLGALIPATQAGRQHLSLHSSLPCPPWPLSPGLLQGQRGTSAGVGGTTGNFITTFIRQVKNKTEGHVFKCQD